MAKFVSWVNSTSQSDFSEAFHSWDFGFTSTSTFTSACCLTSISYMILLLASKRVKLFQKAASLVPYSLFISLFGTFGTIPVHQWSIAHWVGALVHRGLWVRNDIHNTLVIYFDQKTSGQKIIAYLSLIRPSCVRNNLHTSYTMHPLAGAQRKCMH